LSTPNPDEPEPKMTDFSRKRKRTKTRKRQDKFGAFDILYFRNDLLEVDFIKCRKIATKTQIHIRFSENKN